MPEGSQRQSSSPRSGSRCIVGRGIFRSDEGLLRRLDRDCLAGGQRHCADSGNRGSLIRQLGRPSADVDLVRDLNSRLIADL